VSFIANLHRTLDLRVSVQRELLNEMASWAVDRSRCLLSPVNPQTGNQDLSRTKYCDLHRKKSLGGRSSRTGDSRLPSAPKLATTIAALSTCTIAMPKSRVSSSITFDDFRDFALPTACDE